MTPLLALLAIGCGDGGFPDDPDIDSVLKALDEVEFHLRVSVIDWAPVGGQTVGVEVGYIANEPGPYTTSLLDYFAGDECFKFEGLTATIDGVEIQAADDSNPFQRGGWYEVGAPGAARAAACAVAYLSTDGDDILTIGAPAESMLVIADSSGATVEVIIPALMEHRQLQLIAPIDGDLVPGAGATVASNIATDTLVDSTGIDLNWGDNDEYPDSTVSGSEVSFTVPVEAPAATDVIVFMGPAQLAITSCGAASCQAETSRISGTFPTAP